MHWAVDQGATVINMSLTTNTLDWDPSWDEAFQYAFDHDVVGSWPPGTGERHLARRCSGDHPRGPRRRRCRPVGTASNDASTQGITIGLSAPSERLLGVSADGSLVQWNGHERRCADRLRKSRRWSAPRTGPDADNVLNRLIRTAKPAPNAGSGQNTLYGYGLVDAAAAVSSIAVPSVSSNPLGDLAEWVRLYRRANAPRTHRRADVRAGGDPGSPPVESAPRRVVAAAADPRQRAYGTLPLAGATLAAIMITLGVTAAARRIRKARISREPPPHHTNQESLSIVTSTVPKILIVGGGYAGFYTAWKLEKLLGRNEAEVTLVDPLPYMTYQPFLPEVAAGEIEARHVVVGLRRHLKRTTVIAGKVTGISHATKTATITPIAGDDTWTQEYDQIVVTAGAVSRTFPIPGIAENAIA